MTCKLIGQYVQHIEVELAPHECFYAQKGALIYLDAGIEKDVHLQGGGSITRLLGAKLSGESLFIVRFTNRANSNRRLVLGSSSCLLPIKLNNESIICRRGAFVAASGHVSVGAKVSASGIVGGMGLFMQTLHGDCTIFLDCRGQAITRRLNPGEAIEVDENHVLALQGIGESQLQSNWSLRNVLGGEGLSTLRISGPGTVHLSPGSMHTIIENLVK